MNICRQLPALLLMLCAATAFADSAPQTVAQAELKPTPCWFEIPEHRSADCAWFYPGGTAYGETLRLPVVRIPGDAHKAELGSLLYIPGGPGYPAGLDAAGMQHWWRWRDVSRWSQDLWLFDPRGTGLSQPAVDCPEIRAADANSLNQALSVEQEYINQADSARACYERLAAAGQLAVFNSEQQVADIAALMTASGVPHWNIWAVSYGTRTAMHLLRQPPSTLRSVILDSAFPPGINGFLAKPAQLQRALDSLVLACVRRAGCAEQHPKLRAQISQLLGAAQKNPIKLDFLQTNGLQPVALSLTDFRLLWMLFFDSYLTHFDSDTVGAIDRAAQGEYSALEPMAQRFVSNLLDSSFSSAVYFSVTCAEDWPGTTQSAFEGSLAKNPDVAAYLRPEWQHAVCRFWHSGTLPLVYDQPVMSDVPTLFLAGEFDPATLPAWAKTAAQRMPKAHYVEFADASHALTFSNSCAMRSVADFLQTPENWQRPTCAARQPGAHAQD